MFYYSCRYTTSKQFRFCFF